MPGYPTIITRSCLQVVRRSFHRRCRVPHHQNHLALGDVSSRCRDTPPSLLGHASESFDSHFSLLTFLNPGSPVVLDFNWFVCFVVAISLFSPRHLSGVSSLSSLLEPNIISHQGAYLREMYHLTSEDAASSQNFQVTSKDMTTSILAIVDDQAALPFLSSPLSPFVASPHRFLTFSLPLPLSHHLLVHRTTTAPLVPPLENCGTMALLEGRVPTVMLPTGVCSSAVISPCRYFHIVYMPRW